MLALRGGYRVVSVRRGWCCPMTDSDGSSWLNQTHHRAQVSPAAKMAMPRGECVQERAENTAQERRRREQKEKQQKECKSQM